MWAAIVRGQRAADRYLVVNPFFHSFGYKAGILACLLTGATIVPQPVFDVVETLRLIERERHHRAARRRRRSTSRCSTIPTRGSFDLSIAAARGDRARRSCRWC